MNTTPSQQPSPLTERIIKAGVSAGALALAAISFRGCTEWKENRETAQTVVNERLMALREENTNPSIDGSQSAELINSSDLEQGRREVLLTSYRPEGIDDLDHGLSDSEDGGVRVPSNLAKAVHKLTQELESERDFKDCLDKVRDKLKLTLSDEAIERGLARMDQMLEGAIRDLNFEPDQEQRTAALVQSFVDYKLTEALLEARRLWGTSSLTEMNSLSLSDWQYLSTIVDQRNSFQRAELGMAITPVFVPYMQQLLLSQSGYGLPSWLSK